MSVSLLYYLRLLYNIYVYITHLITISKSVNNSCFTPTAKEQYLHCCAAVDNIRETRVHCNGCFVIHTMNSLRKHT